MAQKRIILGVDPGTQVTGVGIIHHAGHLHEAVYAGTIKTNPEEKLQYRYLKIYNELDKIIESYKPDSIAIETQFVYKNVQSALKVGMARGTVLLLAAQKQIPIFEYAPTKAKLAVVGTGSASKHQVLKMIQLLLNLKELKSEDAADALALAICHAHYCRSVHV
ncbi:MAG: crossover junction endodeoxyribonuclease RuvC [Chlamydiales bacterium]|nr:crossover junction endodeoxyribonuclease RuvC [Chlamydiales bacterium]